MKSFKKYIKESMDIDNLFWKIDNWYKNDGDGKNSFTNLVNIYNPSLNDEEFINIVNNNISNIKPFIDYIENNINNEEKDYMYLMRKVLNTVKDNKNNNYNNENTV